MITPADIERASFSTVAHLDGARGPNGWFGYIAACYEYPRLQRLTRYRRNNPRRGEIVWMVDGKSVGSDLADALVLLNAE